MRYKVPQNIDMEDRIVGPLTMVQFVTVMVGGGLVYLAYTLCFGANAILTPLSFWFIGVPIGLVTIAFAFLKVNDQPFPKFAASALLFLVRPKSRIWQKSDNVETLKITHAPNAATKRVGAESLVQKSQLDELSNVLDTGGSTPIPTIASPALSPAPTQAVTPPPTAATPMPQATPPSLIPPQQPAPETPGLHASWEGH